MSDSPTVFVVDDDPAIRKSLRWLIESVGLRVATYSSAREFLEGYEADRPGCLVLDVRMPEMSGLELQEKLNERGILLPVIVVTGYGDVPMAVRSMKAGAVELLEKPISEQVLLDNIQRAIAQDACQRAEQMERDAILARIDRLTPREREVMDLVVAGLHSREIAGQLDVSVKTVEAHRMRIMKKMDAAGVPQLIRMALQAQPGAGSGPTGRDAAAEGWDRPQ